MYGPALALLSFVEKNVKRLDAVINEMRDAKSEITNRKSRCLLRVLVAEYLRVGSIRGGGVLKRIVISNADVLDKHKSDFVLESQPEAATSGTKYLRVNSNRLTPQTACESLVGSRVSQLCDKLLEIPSLSLKTVIGHDLLKDGSVVIQDVSTVGVAPLLLSCLTVNQIVEKPIHVLDCCAAPGNKSLHMIELLVGALRRTPANQAPRCSITIVDRDKKRFESMHARLTKLMDVHPFLEVKFINTDVFEVSSESVTHILLDPSCSGSGIHSDHEQNPQERIAQVSSFQKRLLGHCLDASKFPNACDVVYSTCSIYKEENEEVVNQVLGQHEGWQVVSMKTTLPNKSRGSFEAKLERKVRPLGGIKH